MGVSYVGTTAMKSLKGTLEKSSVRGYELYISDCIVLTLNKSI